MNLILQAIKSLFRKLENKIENDIINSRSDMAQNDPTAPDYVKNRLAWTDYHVGTVLLEETELTFVDGGAELPTTIQLEEGQTYIVTYNGVDYECTAWYWDDAGLLMIGNGDLVGCSVGNAEPFITDGRFMMSGDTSATVKIIDVVAEVHKIDEKYLPEVSWNDLEDKPFYLKCGETIFDGVVATDDYGHFSFDSNISLDSNKVYCVEFNNNFIISTCVYHDDTDNCLAMYSESPTGYLFYIYEYGGQISHSHYKEAINTQLKLKISEYLDLQTLPSIYLTGETIAKGGGVSNVNPSATGAMSLNRLGGTMVGEYSIAIGEGVIAKDKGMCSLGRCNIAPSDDYYTSEFVIQDNTTYPTTYKEGYVISSYTLDSDKLLFLLSDVDTSKSTIATLLNDKSYYVTSYTTDDDGNKYAKEILQAVSFEYGRSASSGKLTRYHLVLNKRSERYGEYAMVIGNGENSYHPSNAHTLDWSGNAWFSGDVYTGSTSGVNKDEGSKKLATEDKVTELALPLPETAQVGQTFRVSEVDENGRVTKVEAVDPVQADMAQNDETKPDYVKNRLAWTDDPKEMALIEEQTVFIDSRLYMQLTGSLVLEVGKTYTVIFNGTTYSCVAYSTTELEGFENAVFLGNLEHLGGTGGNGEPFAIDGYEDGRIYLDTSAEGNYVLEIKGIGEEVHKIDEKYLPVCIVHFRNDGSGNWVADKSSEDVYSAWKNGAVVRFNVARCDILLDGGEVVPTEYNYNSCHQFYAYCGFDRPGNNSIIAYIGDEIKIYDVNGNLVFPY